MRPQGLVQLGRHLLASASGDALAPLEAALAQLSSLTPIADDKVRARVVPLLSIAHQLAAHVCLERCLRLTRSKHGPRPGHTTHGNVMKSAPSESRAAVCHMVMAASE